MNSDNQQITPPEDWVGELDVEYVEAWEVWARRRQNKRYQPSEDFQQWLDMMLPTMQRDDPLRPYYGWWK